ncbi:hypothetical protein ACS0TY_000811 [Phlomoides rotata]
MRSSKSFSVVFFFLLFVSLDFDGTIRRGEAAICSSPSSVFRGPCFIDSNCESTCESEGFDDGKCKGAHRLNPKCICYKPCGGPT